MRRLVAGVVALALLAGACGGGEPADDGPVSEAAAERAVAGLCEILDATDRDAAEATFQDRTHQTLHDLAAAAEAIDRSAAADLLTTKQRVEADLAEPALPEGFGADVDALLAATRAAFEVIGVEAPDCPA